MNTRALLTGLLLLSGRTFSAAPARAVNLPPVAPQPEPLQPSVGEYPSVTQEQTQQCAEKTAQAQKQKSFYDKFKLDSMVTASVKLKKNKNTVLVKNAITTVKEVLVELAEIKMFFCKFKMVVDSAEHSERTGGVLTAFEIELVEQSEISGRGSWRIQQDSNKIKISIDLFDTTHKHYTTPAELSNLFVHEIHHAFIGTGIHSMENDKINFRYSSNPAFSEHEKLVAPYANDKEKTQFSTILKQGEKETINIINMWKEVRKGIADEKTKSMIAHYKKEVNGFNPVVKYAAIDKKYGYCPLREILERVRKGNSIVKSGYEEPKRLYELDAYYHEELTLYPELFKKIFGDLLTWHTEHSHREYHLEYKRCMK